MSRKPGVLVIFLLACCLGGGAVAHATPFQNTLPSGLADSGQALTSLTLDGETGYNGNSWTGTASGALNGSSVDWYTGYAFHFTSGGAVYDEQYSFCVDSSDYQDGQTYHIESLSKALDDLVNSIPAQYMESAWLLNQYRLGNVDPVTAQAAAWDIMFNSQGTFNSSLDYVPNIDVSSWVSQAEQNYQSINPANFYIAVADNSTGQIEPIGNNSQNFLFYVPEPSTSFLLGSGLIGLIAFRLGRRARS